MKTSYLCDILERRDVRKALAYLNEHTPLRFTSLYIFCDDPKKRSYFYDREHPEKEDAEGLPALSPYCVFVREKQSRVQLGQSELDETDSIQSFVGVSITDLSGEVLGSLCHFDLVPHEPLDDIAADLELAAPHFLPLVDSEE